MVMLPLPVPDESVIQPTFAPAVHVQDPLEAVSVAESVPPAAPIVTLPGDKVNAQAGPTTAAAAWVTATVVPATAIVAMRWVVAPFAATVTVTVPDPVPPTLDVVAQGWSEAAVHVQDAALAVTMVLKLSLPAGELCEAGVTVKVHAGGGAGAVVIAASRPSMFAPGVLPASPAKM